MKHTMSFTVTLALIATACISVPARGSIIQIAVGTELSPGDSIDIAGDEIQSVNAFAGDGFNASGQYIGWQSGTAVINPDIDPGIGLAEIGESAVPIGTLIGPSTLLTSGSVFIDYERVEVACCNSYFEDYNYYQDFYNNPVDQDLLFPALFDNGDYGWIDLTVTPRGPGLGFLIDVNSFAYDDTGAAVSAGIVVSPEPSTYGMVFVGFFVIALTIRGARKVIAPRVGK
jgi:hypothetical protein